MSFCTNINDVNIQRFLAGLRPLIGKAYLSSYSIKHHSRGELSIKYYVIVDVITDNIFTGRYPEYKDITISYKMFAEMLNHMYGKL